MELAKFKSLFVLPLFFESSIKFLRSCFLLATLAAVDAASLAAEAGPELSVEAEGDVAAELGEDGVAAEEAGELIGHEVFYEE